MTLRTYTGEIIHKKQESKERPHKPTATKLEEQT